MTNNIAKTDTTELERVLNVLASHNSRYVELLQKLESMGHKMKNTNYPQPESKSQEIPQSDGLMHEIFLQLDYYSMHNTHLQEIADKLSQLI